MTYGGKSKWIRLCNFFCIQNPGADTRLTQEKIHGIMIAQQKRQTKFLGKRPMPAEGVTLSGV